MSDQPDPPPIEPARALVPAAAARDEIVASTRGRFGTTLALAMIAGGALVVIVAGTIAVARGGRGERAEPPEKRAAANLAVRREPPPIAALAVEPLAVKIIVRPPWRRERPAFGPVFNAAIKPYIARDYGTAVERMHDLAVLFPNRPEPLVYGGVSHLLLGHPHEAIELLNRAAPLTREAFAEDILWYLALAHRSIGSPDGALMELRRVCAIGADHGPRACAAVREIDARANASR